MNQLAWSISPNSMHLLSSEEAAKALGITNVVGTLEPGKMADVTVWDGNPFSVYTKAQKVFIDGALAYDRANPDVNRSSPNHYLLYLTIVVLP